MSETQEIIQYILARTGGISTFRLSRTLLLLDLEWNRAKGGKRTELHYVLYPSGFYIEEFPDFLENIEGVEKVVDEKTNKKVFRLKSDIEPKISEEVGALLDRILEETKDMDDHALNQYVISREDYKKLL
jgi:hypothetical protein